MPILIIGIILVVLAVFAVAGGSKRKTEDKLKNSWAKMLADASKNASGSINQFRTAWKLAELDKAFLNAGFTSVALMAISAHETGWGQSHAAVTHNNLSGISDSEEPRKYDDIAGWFADMKRLLAMPRYSAARALADSPVQFVEALRKCGYNSNLSWQQGVLGCLEDLLNAGESV
jgi:uncharacterized FlgJ-related protein